MNRWVILLVFFVAILLFLFGSLELTNKNVNQSLQDLAYALATALTAGLIIALIQYLLDWKNQKSIDDFKKMGVKKILSDRENEDYYRTIISESNERIWVLGNTSYRLLLDFADYRENKSKKRALIDALKRGIEVKILVAEKRQLKSEKDKQNFDHAKSRFEELKKEFPDKFFYKYYRHIPNHSIFVFDSECFLGPIFPELKSKDTPSIHSSTKTEFAKKYLNYFDAEWNKIK